VRSLQSPFPHPLKSSLPPSRPVTNRRLSINPLAPGPRRSRANPHEFANDEPAEKKIVEDKEGEGENKWGEDVEMSMIAEEGENGVEARMKGKISLSILPPFLSLLCPSPSPLLVPLPALSRFPFPSLSKAYLNRITTSQQRTHKAKKRSSTCSAKPSLRTPFHSLSTPSFGVPKQPKEPSRHTALCGAADYKCKPAHPKSADRDQIE
jgi:hypothetical protein